MPKRYHQAVLVSCEIPWNEKYELMEGAFREQVRDTIKKFNDLYIFGTAGEGYAVTIPQFTQIVKIFREETGKPGVNPMVGCIGMSTAQVIERVGIGYDAGFRMFQVALPPWGMVSDNEYMTFFKDVCGAFPNANFLHYNLVRPKRLLYAKDYLRLQDAVPNLVATKNTLLDIYQTVELAANTELQHFYSETQFPVACTFGEASLLSSFGAYFTKKTKEFFSYGVRRDFDKLIPMQAKYLRIAIEMFEPAAQMGNLIDGAYDKIVARAAGAEMSMRLLSPYEAVTEEVYQACVNVVKTKYPDWIG
ncbi:MAG: hypothetical protein FJ319_11210 [SAR202 cluster bacterium]|nr:hypothetical protein [SAR202 cluster bacterium]